MTTTPPATMTTTPPSSYPDATTVRWESLSNIQRFDLGKKLLVERPQLRDMVAAAPTSHVSTSLTTEDGRALSIRVPAVYLLALMDIANNPPPGEEAAKHHKGIEVRVTPGTPPSEADVERMAAAVANREPVKPYKPPRTEGVLALMEAKLAVFETEAAVDHAKEALDEARNAYQKALDDARQAYQKALQHARSLGVSLPKRMEVE